MKRLMMIAVLLPMPLFAAEGTGGNTTATCDDVLDYVRSLNLGSVVGDVSVIKEVVTNQAVQVVEFQNTATVASVTESSLLPGAPDNFNYYRCESSTSCTVTYRVTTTYVDRGGAIPGVVVHGIDGVTLPAGTYLFQGLDNESRASWRWTGAAGHATGRHEGDVVWPMTRTGVFTFASATTIKAAWTTVSSSPRTHRPGLYSRVPLVGSIEHWGGGGIIERLR